MSKNHNPDIGKQITDTVRTALESGDLSRLKDIGPTVQNAVRETISTSVQNTNQNTNQSTFHTYPSPKAPPASQVPPGATYQQQPSAQSARQPVHSQQPTQLQQQGWQSRNGALRPSTPRNGYGIGSVVFGVMGVVAFGLSALFLGLAYLTTATAGLLYWAAGLLAPLAISTGLLSGGLGKRGLLKRLRRYMLLFGDKNVVTIEELSQATGCSQNNVRRDIRKAIDKKIIRGLRMDVLETCVIQGEEAYRLYLETEEARKQREAEEAERQRKMQDPETASIEAFRMEGKATIRKIREANAAIPGEEISSKLDKLENSTANIFTYVEKHPEKLPDTRKFMSYYLPTTLKLVEKYRQYDAMDIQMSNVSKAKRDIEKSLDTIDLAFNNLLESLYHEDTLDVTTDIEVLETMLEQEGLTGKRFDIDAQ